MLLCGHNSLSAVSHKALPYFPHTRDNIRFQSVKKKREKKSKDTTRCELQKNRHMIYKHKKYCCAGFISTENCWWKTANLTTCVFLFLVFPVVISDPEPWVKTSDVLNQSINRLISSVF